MMDAKVHRWVQRHGWDRACDDYETFWRDQLRPAHDAVLALAALRPGERVVDVACGTGLVTLPAARAVGPAGSVLAVDLSPRMVDEVGRRATARGLDNIGVCTRGAEDLGPVEPFDVALCALGLMYVPEPSVAVCELARVLRPGGRMVAAVWGERRRCGWSSVFPIVDARVSSDVCPTFFALGTPGALAGLARQAGFVEVAERRLATELVYPDATAAAGAAFLGGPVALAYSRFDDATRAAVRAEYVDSIEPYRDGAGYRVPGEFVTVTGRTAPTATDTTHHHHQPQQQGAMP